MNLGRIEFIIWLPPKPAAKPEPAKPAPKVEPAKPAQKTGAKTAAQPAKGAKKNPAGRFDPADYLKPGLTEDDIEEIKEAFDLFYTDGSGTV